jgi:pimeloyl-ACP methyl ester carboxylesterase
MKESFTTADGRTLSFNRTGAGPLLVCHAEGPGFSGATLGDLGGLGDRVVLDPRGTGRSTVPAGGYRQEDYIADLEELRFDEPARFRDEVTRFLTE